MLSAATVRAERSTPPSLSLPDRALTLRRVLSPVLSAVLGILRALQASEVHCEQLQTLMDGLHAAAEQQRLLQLMAGAQSALRRFNAQHSLSAEKVEELREQWQEAMQEQSEVDRLLSDDLTAGVGWADGGAGVSAEEVEAEYEALRKQMEEDEQQSIPAASQPILAPATTPRPRPATGSAPLVVSSSTSTLSNPRTDQQTSAFSPLHKAVVS